MEAALRTAADWLEGKDLPSVDYHEVRGMADVKEATYHVGGMDVNVAVTSGLSNVAKLLDAVRAGEKNYHFIEVMCCPGGCINGGGQPIQPASVRNFVDVKGLRSKAIYEADKAMPIRKSHQNPSIQKVYDEFYGKPGSHKAHECLHTSYVKREKY